MYYIPLADEDKYWSSGTLDEIKRASDDYKVAQLSTEELDEIISYIDDIETEEMTDYSVAACDAGTHRISVYRYSDSGEVTELPIYMAGDSVGENTDESAIALSSYALSIFDFTKNLGRKSYLSPYCDRYPTRIFSLMAVTLAIWFHMSLSDLATAFG